MVETQYLAALEARIAKLEHIVGLLSAAQPGRKPPAKPGRQGPGRPMDKSRIEDLRARWPAMSMHPESLKAFDRHVAALGKEPQKANIQKLVEPMDFNAPYQRGDLQIAWAVDAEKATALAFFAKIAGWLVFVKKKGYMRTTA